MGSSEAFGTNGMSDLNAGLTQSLLDSASLNSSLSDNSILTGLERESRAKGAQDPFDSELNRLSTLDTRAGNNSSKSNQDFSANPSSPAGNALDDSLLFKQPDFLASVPSLPLSSNSTTSENTTGKDLLTGSTPNTPLVGSLTSDDTLTGAASNIKNSALALWSELLELETPLSIDLVVADLPAEQLASSQIARFDEQGRPSGGTIKVDDDANGNGWFIDPTPFENSEFNQTLSDTAFRATTNSPAFGHYDLLTVMLHEVGHVAGFMDGYPGFSSQISTKSGTELFVTPNFSATLSGDHLDPKVYPTDLLNPMLAPSVRFLPSTLDVELLNAVRNYPNFSESDRYSTLNTAGLSLSALLVTENSVSQKTPRPTFAVTTEGTLSINNGGDFDGVPADPKDDALIHAGRGFTINNNPILPHQRDANGNPIRNASGKLLLVDKALTVAQGYTVSNASGNQYANLLPPLVVEKQTVTVPAYADVLQQELASRIPQGTATVSFNAQQNPINNATEWASKFPRSGTASNPKVVRVTNGGLNIPGDVDLSDYVITVENGDINFNGSGHDLNSVVLVTNNGNINLGNVQSGDFSAFASKSINMNGGARFTGSTLLANGSSGGSITFNGATTTTEPTNNLTVISLGRITYNAAASTRGTFSSVGNFTFNNKSTLLGTIAAKGNIIFNGNATVTAVATETASPVITAALANDTANSGTTNTDRITFDPTIVGTVTDNSRIVSFRAGFDDTPQQNFVDVVADLKTDGSFTFSSTQLEAIYGGSLPDGPHTLHLVALDEYGNVSNVFDISFTLDTTSSVPTGLDLPAINDSGTNDSDNITNNTTPTISGNAQAGELVQLFSDGQLVGQTTATNTNTWEIVTSNLADGIHALSATAIDVAGNKSPLSDPLNVVIDTTTPKAPIELRLTASTDTGASNSDNITNNTTPQIQGKGEAGSLLRLFEEDQLVGQTTANADGDWLLSVETLSDGQYTFTATVEDIAGNVSASSDKLAIAIDTTAAAPTGLDLLAQSDSGTSDSDNITNNTTPTIFGNAQAGALVQLFSEAQLVGQTTGSTAGTWEIATSNLADGTYALRATAIDVAGNKSPATDPLNVVIDTQTPIAPSGLRLTASTDTGASNSDNITNNTTPQIQGTGEAGSLLRLFKDEHLVGKTTANADGDWLLSTTALSDALYTFTTTAEDLAGNVSSLSEELAVTIDTTTPSAPTGLDLLADNDSGSSSSDNVTNNTTPTIAGNAKAGSVVQLFSDGQLVGQTTATPNDTWLLSTSTLVDRVHNLSATAIDVAGNVSTVSQLLQLTIDTVSPALTLHTPVDTTPLTKGAQLVGTVDGTGSAATKLEYHFDSLASVPVSLGITGAFDQELDLTGLNNGPHTLTVTTTDVAGNTTTTSFNVAVKLDTTPPAITAALASDSITNYPTITGTVTDASLVVEFRAGFDNTPVENFVDVFANLAADGSFTFDRTRLETIYGGTLPDGSHTLHLVALDEYGNISNVFDFIFTLDTTAPEVVFDLAPAFDSNPLGDGETTFETVTLVGQSEANATVVVEETGSVTTADTTGRFEFAGVGLALGANSFNVRSTDLAGNKSVFTRTILRLGPGDFDSGLTGWTVASSGGSATGHGSVVANAGDAILQEGNSFIVALERTFQIPKESSMLTFTYSDLSFDTTDSDSINDAFEVALVDALGNSLVHTIGSSRDVFFNMTENKTAVLGAGTTLSGQTVTVNLSELTAGSTATLQFRLVNDDSDVHTSVRIQQMQILPGTETAIPAFLSEPASNTTTEPIDFSSLSDVSTSLKAEYGQTSFNENTDVLYANLAVENAGQYSVGGPLYVGVTNLSDPTVRLQNADGVTPDGIAYYDYTTLVVDGTLKPDELTGARSLAFYNPQRTQFTYDLVFLGQLNQAPKFTTDPDVEALIGREYVYNALANDLDEDKLTYSFLSAPDGMAIDSATGQITWTPSASDIGTHAVMLRVEDGRGDAAQQQYVLSAITPPPNRPPLFTSVPAVDANVNTPYTYQAVAADADGDKLTFSLTASPYGMTVNPNTGVVTWTPIANQLGTQDVTLTVTDSQGGTAEQSFVILAQQQLGNNAPVIISDPFTKFNLPGTINLADGDVNPTLIDLDLPLGGTATETVSLTVPSISSGKSFADILFVVDESGSMGGYHTWLKSMVQDLDAALQAQGIGANQYGLVGFGGGGSHLRGHPHLVGGKPFGTATELAATTSSLRLDGGTEDGYDGINTALNNYTFRPGAAVNIILVTDEDRDVVDRNLSFNSILNAFNAKNALLNAVVNGTFRNGSGKTALGVDSNGNAYSTNGSGGFTSSPSGVFISGSGTTKINYIDLAWAIDGAAWDLNQLKAGGLTATSFTKAFVDIKTNEIEGQLSIDLIASDPSVKFENLTGEISGVGGGETVSFTTQFTGDGKAHSFDLLFVRPGSNIILGEVPVTINNDYFYPVKAIDEDGDTLTYSLAQTPAGATIDATTGQISWEPTADGQYDFTVQVDDGRGGLATQDYSVTVTAGAVNTTPVITSTAPTEALFDQPFTYTVKASDPDGDFLAYYLDTAPEGMKIDRTTGAINWTPTSTQAGTQAVKVRLLDGRGGEATQSFTLTVGADLENSAPQITSTPLTATEVGQLYRYQATASDPDGDALRFDLALKPEGMTIDESTGTVVWQPSEQSGVHTVVLRVRDGRGGIDLQAFEVTVGTPNTAPVITATPPAPAVVGLPYQYRVQAQDADGEALTYRLDAAPSGMVIDETTGVVNWTPTTDEVGTTVVAITAIDSRLGETTKTFNLDVLAEAPNNVPIITSSPRNTISLGNSYFYTLQASDPNGDPLSFSLDTAPKGMSIDAKGRVFWQPTPTQFGSNSVKIRVADGRGGFVVQDFTVNVVTQALNQSPSIVSTPPLTATANRQYQYNLAANDPEGDPPVWGLDTAPAGMSIDPTQGTIRWTPTPEQVGTHEVAVRVVDAQGAFVGQAFTLTVRGVNTAPTITSIPLTSAAAGKAYTYSVKATDIEADPLTFTLASAPSGMTINADTGLIQWTPSATQVGAQAVEILVGDSLGGTATQPYTIAVSNSAANQAPAIASTPKFVASVGDVYNYTVTATDPDGDTPTFALLQAPQGMTIDPSTGLVQWTPTLSQVGTHSIIVGATDSSGAGGAQRFAIAAAVNTTPTITSTPVQSVTAGASYRYDLRASDPEGNPLSYSLKTGPQDMTLDALGRLIWNPGTSDIGTHPIVLTAKDNYGAAVQQSYTLTVAADTQAPKVSILATPTKVNVGSSVTLIASATDNVKVSGLQLVVNGTPVTLDAQGRATVKLSQVGDVTAIATASDKSGNSGQASTKVQVIDPTDTEAPVINLDLSAIASGVITAPTDIIGTVTDSNLDRYTLEVAPVAGGPFTEVFEGTESVTNGVLGKFDPSLLSNDTYTVRLSAYDLNGYGSMVEDTLSVAGDLKLGNFQLSFTDLSIPVSGIPITLTRTYDTLTANTRDDFGYGWRMEFRDTDLRTSLLPPDELQQEMGVQNPFKDGTRVYITLPGGKREGFTFKPRADRLSGFLRGAAVNAGISGDPGLYHPEFVADKGVTSKLTVSDAYIIHGGDTTQYYGMAGVAYNPAEPYFGGKYTLTTKEGIVYEIDGKTGDLLTVTDPNGNKLTYTDAAITSSTGQKITFGRDAQGRISTVTDPLGQLLRYQYDAQGDLVAVTDREDNTTRFGYNSTKAHYLDKVIDPLGKTGVRNEYDENGRLKKLFDVNGKPVEMVYDPANSVQTVTDQLGHVTTYEYDSRGNVVTEIDAEGKITKRRYDDDNNVLEETVISDRSGPAGFTTKYTYDSKGNQLTEEDPLKNITRKTYGQYSRLSTETDPLGRTTTNTYDKRGNLRSSLDAAGYVTTYDNDPRGQLLWVTDALKQTTRFTYDLVGNVETVTDALNHTTTYTYDANGNKKTETRKMTTPIGVRELVTTWTYDEEGRVKTITDAEKHTTTYEYDKLGRQIAVIDALNRRTEYVYNDKGELIETIYPDSTPNTKDDNPRTKTKYDAAGREIETIDQLGHVTKYRYDKVGRLIETIYPDLTPQTDDDNPRAKTEYYTDGLVKAQIDERGNRTEYRLDAAGRQLEIIYTDDTPTTLADNPRTTFKYDNTGQQISQTDALNHTTSYVYDDLGRLTQTRFHDQSYTTNTYDALGRRIASTDQARKTTEYRYNALGRLTGVKNALGDWTEYGYNEVSNLVWTKDAKEHTTWYEYDGVGRRTATILPLDQRSDTTYDAVGNVLSQTDFNRNTITYRYDELNRLKQKNFPDSTKTTFTYTPTGQRQTVTDARGTTVYDYDERDRLLSRTDPNGKAISYTYDAADNLTSVTTPTGTTRYTFDVRNRLDTVIDPDSGVTDYEYDAVGNLIRTVLPNGTVEVRQYDDLNRLKYLENKKTNGEIISSYRYTLDTVGHRKVVEENTGLMVNYTYDDLYRLTKEEITDTTNGNLTFEYSYDKVGNRKTKVDSVEGSTTYIYDDNDRLLTETLNDIVTQYTYDDNGNTIKRTNATKQTLYDWDYENRLISAEVTDAIGTQQMQYQYDADGVRVAATVDGQQTRYLIDTNQPYAQVLEEYTPDGTVQVFYVYGNDLISQDQGDTRTFYHVDGLGSTVALTDTSGNVVSTYNYEAFGELLNSTGSVSNKYLFAGEQYDQNLGQYYLRQRYYNAETGRFTRRDTYAGSISEPLTLHKYVYANDNPVNGVDPSGLSTLSETLSTLNILSQFAARAYTTVLSPVVIDMAKAWAVITGVGAVSLLVLEETKKGGETSLKVVPDEALEPKQKEPKAPPSDPQQMNQMRLQLQDTPGHTFGIPIVNVPEVGVTVGQVGQAVLALWSYRRTLASWFPEDHDTALIKGMAGVTKKAKDSYPDGVFQGNSQVYSRQWNKNDPKGNRPVSKGYYRVDFENLRGYNLRNL